MPQVFRFSLLFVIVVFLQTPYSARAQGLRSDVYEVGPMTLPPPPLQDGEYPVPELGDTASSVPSSFTIEEPAVGGPSTPIVHWYYPWTWIPLDGWTNTAELGLNGTEGNAQSMSFQVGTRFVRKNDFHNFEMKITHNRTQANSVETQNNALLFADYERPFQDSPWALFTKFGLEYDAFRAFDLRLNTNGGISYAWVENEALTFKTRFGAGVSREFGGPDDEWKPEAVFGGTYEHQVNKRNKLLAKFDYFPEWTDFANYRFVLDAGWEYLLNDEGNLSFKLGVNDRYDSTPNGAKPNDINYNALLLYKF